MRSRRPGGCPHTRKHQKRGGIVNRTGNGRIAYPINVRLLFRKAEMGQTLVLDLPQQIVLEERLDLGVLVRLAGRVLLPQPLHTLLGQQPSGKVLGAQVYPGLLGAVRVGGRGWVVSGVMCDFLPFVLRRMGSRPTFPIHGEITVARKSWYEEECYKNI
jgi:hypothetical protein